MGWRASKDCAAARLLHREYSPRKSVFWIFFRFSRKAHDDTALLYLARVLDNDKRSVTLSRLLRIVENNSKLFSSATPSEVQAAVKEDRRRLAEDLQPLLSNLKAHRDKVHAHLDEQLLGGMAVIRERYPLSSNDMGHLLSEVEEMFKRYYRLHFGRELSLGPVYGENDVEWLLQFIRDRGTEWYESASVNDGAALA